MKVNSDKKVVYFVCVSFVIMMQGLFFRPLAGPDCYNAIMDPESYYRAALYGSGRFVHAFYFWIIALVGRLFSVTSAYYYSFVLNALFLVFSLYRYAVTIADMLCVKVGDTYHFVISSVLSCMTIANIFMCEYFLYPESIFVLVTWLNVEAVALFWKMTKTRNRHLNIIIIALLMLSGFGYQIIPNVYFVLTLPMIMIRSHDLKSFILNQVSTGLHYVAGVLPGSVFAKLIVKSPRGGFKPESVTKVINNYKPTEVETKVFILDRITSGMWVYMAACALIATLLLLVAIKRKEYREIVKGIYIVLVTIFMGILPFVIGVTNDYHPRIYYVIGTIFGTLVLYGLLIEYLRVGNNIGFAICGCSVVVLIAVQFINFFDIARERYITNYEDRYISEMIGNEIDKYEIDSRTEIKKVVFYQDSNRTKYIDNKGWCLSMRAYGVEWGNSSALNYYLNREYQIGETDDDLTESFAQKNWNAFSKEQIIFKGDTAHICRY